MSKKIIYRKNDMVYDIESLDNVFTLAQLFPAQNKIIVSYLEDPNQPFIQTEKELKYIERHIKKVNKGLNNTTILFENLASPYPQGSKIGNTHIGSALTFIKRFGMTCRDNYQNKYTPDAPNGRNVMSQRLHNGMYLVKDTDPNYDPDEHGIFVGYNSINYDLTMLSYLLSLYSENLINTGIKPNGELATMSDMSHAFTQGILTHDDLPKIQPRTMREFNNHLFNQHKKRMPNALRGERNQHPESYYIYKGAQLSNRHVDVACQAAGFISLKRASGLLGYQIKDSNKLSGNNTVIKNLDELAELIAYNVSDILCTSGLFSHKLWNNTYRLKQNLINTQPQIIYRQDGDTGKPYIHHHNVNPYRLTVNNTSAQFVERIIAPYEPLEDLPCVSYMYPHPDVAAELGIEPYNVLEYVRDWINENVGHGEFDSIYNLYKELEGKNTNDTLCENTYKEEINGEIRYVSHNERYPFIDKNALLRKHHVSANHNTNYFYKRKDKDGNVVDSSCLINFSYGGAHGQEIDEVMVQRLLQANHTLIDTYYEIRERYHDDATEAYKENPKVRIYVPKPTNKYHYEWIEKPIRSLFFKAGSSIKNGATWKDEALMVKKTRNEVIFKKKSATGLYGIDEKVRYVSMGFANHEDYTSYYPTLLINLRAFLDRSGVDQYKVIFTERVELKNKLKPLEKQIKHTTEQMQQTHDDSHALEQLTTLLAQLEDEYTDTDINQDARKLLLNSASGAADVVAYSTNIRINNTILSMRIIGQLFAFVIGQAQTLGGARVPSTNTDGLYTMDISPELNDKILDDVKGNMLVGIEPERLDRFITKDSNNRIEIHGGRIVKANGASLAAYKGASPMKSISHPPIVDYVLAQYLMKHDDPANHAFDRTLATQIMKERLQHENVTETLLYLQWIIAASASAYAYPFGIHMHYNEETSMYEEITDRDPVEIIQICNRVFLTKTHEAQPIMVLKRTAMSKINATNVAKRQKDGLPVFDPNPRALRIMCQNGHNHRDLLELRDTDNSRKEANIVKISGMPELQNVRIVNDDLHLLTEAEQQVILNEIDINTYINMVEKTFMSSWVNASSEHVGTFDDTPNEPDERAS